MSDFFANMFVSWFVIVPLLTALAVVLVPASQDRLIRWVSLVGAGVLVVLAGILCLRYAEASAGDFEVLKDALHTRLYFEEFVPWFASQGINYRVGVDGISVFMIVLTAIIIFTGVLASWHVETRAKEFFALLLVLVGGVFGVFISFDLFLFFVFYELAVLPMYLLIGVWGTGRKEYSAMKLTLMLLVGSAFVLVGMFAMYHASGLGTFDLLKLATVKFPLALQQWAFPMIFIGFGVLGALYPFHTWSPDGHAAAPTAVSMLHAGVLMKLGGYGALRIAIYLLPEGAKMWGVAFMALTTVNIVYGAFGAISQKDLKYFTAYSSVSHCGFVLFGIATLNMIGLKGAVIQMFSHGIMTGLFFALIGMVYGRTHTRQLDEMGGLAKVMPWLATCFYIAGLASLGLPGLAGFVAESHVFLGGVFANPWGDAVVMRALTIIATMSIVITAVYVLRGLAKVFQGPIRNAEFSELSDALVSERLATGILVATLVVAGLGPFIFMDMIEHSLMPIVNRLHATGAF